jgi:hypothetical protein
MNDPQSMTTKKEMICAWTYLAFSFARLRLVRWSFVLTNHAG